jgi:hypothetical protein
MKIPAMILGILCASTLSAQTVKTIIKNGGYNNRYDIVIIGDGYQASEQTKFDNNVLAVINKLFDTEPYKTFKTFFNVHTVFRASKESGADHPDAKPPIVKDTVYDASYNTGGTPRCLYIKNQSQALADASLAPAVEGRVMVIVNDSRYGGCAGTFAVTYNGSSMTTVQVHEFGHSFGGLADEYDYPNTTYTGSEPGQKNVTKDPTGQVKWAKWIGFNGVSAFEGAKYYRYGLYRPKSNCIMRTLNSNMCPVCKEQTVVTAYTTVSAIDKPRPASKNTSVNPGTRQDFSFTNIAPASSNSTIEWRVDNIPLANTGTSISVDTTGMSLGIHTVQVKVTDQSAYVRNDPASKLESIRVWNLNVSPQLPDLTPSNLFAANTTVTAGGVLQLVSHKIANIGVVTSPAVSVEYFLSPDKSISTSDTFLGTTIRDPLTAGQSTIIYSGNRTVPPHVLAGTYNLGVVVDRTNQVKELDETNNVSWITVSITDPNCVPRLSYDDPLIYPHTANTLRGSTGGSVHPVVTAKCAKGSAYLILLGCSGTAPGTPLTPKRTLPLNIDACSQVWFSAIGTPILSTFFGTIDANGKGRASLVLPSGLTTATLDAHFAAIVFDSSNGVVINVTNPVKFDLK